KVVGGHRGPAGLPPPLLHGLVEPRGRPAHGQHVRVIRRQRLQFREDRQARTRPQHSSVMQNICSTGCWVADTIGAVTSVDDCELHADLGWALGTVFRSYIKTANTV